jgi:hypothetical protein
MDKRNLLSIIVGALLVFSVAGACFAGVEPSPFEPEINKLHSIELQLAAINKRVAKLNELETLPEGSTNYLTAMANQTQGLKVRLAEVLLMLPLLTPGGTYIGQDEVVFSLDSIRIDSKATYSLIERIVSRMGVEPSPFLPLFNDASVKIIVGTNDYLLPILDPVEPPLSLPTLTLP